jgi:hypothetical protein
MDSNIKTKKELTFYIAADRIMKGLPAHRSMKDRVFSFLGFKFFLKGGHTLEYLRIMRCVNFYTNSKGIFNN